MSPQILTTIAQAFGQTHILRNGQTVFILCGLMTTAELLIGIGLLVRRLRRVSMYAAVIMHVTLIAVLGPLGLNHHAGVLIWNTFLGAAVPLLFLSTSTKPGCKAVSHGDGLWHRFATFDRKSIAAVLFVIAFPLSGLFSFADNWLSWQLYSPRPEVVRVYVKSASVVELPDSVQPFIAKPAPLQDWCPIRMDLWSLAAVNAPLYPEDRFQLAIAGWLAEHVEPDSVRVTIDSPKTIYWQARQSEEFVGREQIRQYAAQYPLNGIAVRMPFRLTRP
jgi:hypothetical protein